MIDTIQPSYYLRIFFWLCAGAIFCANASSNDSHRVLYKYEGATLRDSEWGRIPEFQNALSNELIKCGGQAIETDGIYGNGTHKALLQLGTCGGYEDLLSNGNVSVVNIALWQRLMPGTSLPSTHERAFALVLSHEATDYDRVEWNYGTDDDKSALTWGPYGATVGWGNEVRAVLKRIDHVKPGLLSRLFGSSYSTIETLMEAAPEQGYRILKPIYSDHNTRAYFQQKFQKLGHFKVARAEYDAYAFDTNKWLAPNFRRLYSLIPEGRLNATEIDYAFFFDLGMHVSVRDSRIHKAHTALLNEESQLGRPLTPAERRRVIGLVFVAEINSRWANDRLGRNVVFYVDGVGESSLDTNERSAWKQRTQRSASQFGLSDERLFFPEFLE